MKTEQNDIQQLLKMALQAQVDLGLGEMIVNSPSAAGGNVAELMANRKLILKQGTPETTAVSFVTTFGSLDEHFKAICECLKCPLGKSRNKFVYGVGNPDADILFIGEGPGATEDELGEPFVGRAGQLLDKILAAIQLSRAEVYIANIVKCRPPGNRDPQPEEMEACFPYLNEQIALIKPKLICCLGRVAAQALLRTKTPLGKLRQQWQDYGGIPTLVTYHPAALLRFASYKRDTWEDMKMLKARYDQMVGA